MKSDPKRLDQALQHIRRIKAGNYTVIMGNSAAGGGYQIVERPWQEIPEASKLAILQDAVNWSGISNRDQAHILLSEVGPGQTIDSQRNRVIDAATRSPSLRDLLQTPVSGHDSRQREPDNERGNHDGKDRDGRSC